MIITGAAIAKIIAQPAITFAENKITEFLKGGIENKKAAAGFNKLTEDQQIRLIASLRNNVPLIDKDLLSKYAIALKKSKEMPKIEEIDRTLNTLRNIHEDEKRIILIIGLHKISKFDEGVTFSKLFLNQFDINGDSGKVIQNEGLVSTVSVSSYVPTSNFYITAKYLKIVSILNIEDNSYYEMAYKEHYDKTPIYIHDLSELKGVLDECFLLTQVNLKKFTNRKDINGVSLILRKLESLLIKDLNSVELMSIERMLDPLKHSNLKGIECIAIMKKRILDIIYDYFNVGNKELINFLGLEENISKSFKYLYNDFNDFNSYKEKMKNRNVFWYLFLFDNLEKPLSGRIY